MVEDELSFLQRRAETESRRAEQTEDATAARVHAQLADAYRRRAAELMPERAASHA